MFFLVGYTASTQALSQYQTFISIIMNINEHYLVVSFLLFYSQLLCFVLLNFPLFFLFIFSVCFTIFNCNKICEVKTFRAKMVSEMWVNLATIISVSCRQKESSIGIDYRWVCDEAYHYGDFISPQRIIR